MKRPDDFLCELERRHPWMFALLLTLLIVLFYVAAGDSATLFHMPGATT